VTAATEIRYPQREDYYPTVRAFLPGCEGEELDNRASLLLMRDRALATKPACSDVGWEILDLVQRTASDLAFKSMPAVELKTARYLLVRLISAASGFDSMWAPQLDLGGAPEGLEGVAAHLGGTDAGG
jgi:hypothetical protein